MEARMELTDEQWDVIEPLIIRLPSRPDGKGRPRQNDRPLLDAMLWILRTGAPWKDLPKRYPPYQRVHRRFGEWVDNGTFEQILTVLATELQERGELDLSECFIDGTFTIAKKGGRVLERPSAARVRRSWQLQTVLVFL